MSVQNSSPHSADRPPLPPQFLLAEELDTNTIARLNHTSQETRGAIRFGDAWTALEIAIATGDESSFHSAQAEFTNLYRYSPNTRTQEIASRTLSFWPNYLQRVRSEAYSAEAIRASAGKLGNLVLARVDNVDEVTVSFGSVYVDLAMALCANNGDSRYLMFPGSAREQISRAPGKLSTHDGYVVRDQKIPVKIGAMREPTKDKKLADAIHKLNMRPTLTNQALEAYPGRWRPQRTAMGKRLSLEAQKELYALTAQLIIADANGETVSGDDAVYLDGMMAEMRKRIDDFHHGQSQPNGEQA